jgi:hypothetical protein
MYYGIYDICVHIYPLPHSSLADERGLLAVNTATVGVVQNPEGGCKFSSGGYIHIDLAEKAC